MMSKSLNKALLASSLLAGAAMMIAPVAAYANPVVGGAPMYENKNIVENAVNSKDNTTLVTAVKAAGLVDTLESAGPFTVFAPTNEAFNKLPPGTVENLLKPENKAKLSQILTFHVVPGKLNASDLEAKIKEGHGKATLKTVEGKDLTLENHDGKIELKGSGGSHAYVEIANVEQSNGVIHVINGVLLP
jgi:uncharacterized surface protein with fasciclin (FAS1) repeats